MMKKRFIWKYIVSFFICSSVFCFNSNGYDDVSTEEFLKGRSTVSELARKCKSEWDGQGCNDDERRQLVQYTVQFCGEMPENAHPVSVKYLVQYMNVPMINMAFLRVWSLLNGGDIEWAVCAVCLFDYPPHPYWEKNISYCDK